MSNHNPIIQDTEALFRAKKELRKFMKTSLQAFWASCTLADRNRLGTLLAEKVQEVLAWKASLHVCVFLSMPDEVDTEPLIAEALQQKKQVYVPRIEGLDIEFVSIQAEWTSWTKDAWNIPVPPRELVPVKSELFIREPSLIVVPGLAYDKMGRRLGRGKGFYDRYIGKLFSLAQQLQKPMPFLVGVGLAFQLVDTIPAAEHDMKVNSVIVV